MHSAIHTKIKVRADIKNATAQSCILPDFSFSLSLKEKLSIPKAMRYLAGMSLCGNPGLLPVNQILCTLKIMCFFHGLRGGCMANGVDNCEQRVSGNIKPLQLFNPIWQPRKHADTLV